MVATAVVVVTMVVVTMVVAQLAMLAVNSSLMTVHMYILMIDLVRPIGNFALHTYSCNPLRETIYSCY